MSELADNSIQCCVTSPPFWGLRDYDAPNIDWGDGFMGQLGQEPEPELYIIHLIGILEEVKRVLRKDGVCFVNIGDGYYGGGFGHSENQTAEEFARRYPKQGSNMGTRLDYTIRKKVGDIKKGKHSVLKPKDLTLIPERLAIAAQEAAWYIRCDIIWEKPNGFCQSVIDRPTRIHEYIWQLTKTGHYYWDKSAVLEPYIEPLNRWGGDNLIANGESLWDENTGQTTYRDRNMRPDPGGRNRRSVWHINTSSSGYSNYAVFPEELPELCIKAATKEGDTVLDPFAGSGTTLAVARKMGRKAVGYELSEKYCALIRRRNEQGVLEALDLSLKDSHRSSRET